MPIQLPTSHGWRTISLWWPMAKVCIPHPVALNKTCHSQLLQRVLFCSCICVLLGWIVAALLDTVCVFVCSVLVITPFSFSLLAFSDRLFVFCLGISIQSSVLVDPVTKLSTTTSTLEYTARKEDTDAQFTCSTQHTVGAELVSSPVALTITCESQ